eukprot:s326_g39.t1
MNSYDHDYRNQQAYTTNLMGQNDVGRLKDQNLVNYVCYAPMEEEDRTRGDGGSGLDSIALVTVDTDDVVENEDMAEYNAAVEEPEERGEKRGAKEVEQEAEVGRLPLREGTVKALSGKQRQHLQESIEDMEKEESALWSTVAAETRGH